MNLNLFNLTVTLLGDAHGSTSMVFQARICANHGISHRKSEYIMKSKSTDIVNLITFTYLHIFTPLRINKVLYHIYNSNLLRGTSHPGDITNTSIFKIRFLNNPQIYHNFSTSFITRMISLLFRKLSIILLKK